MFLKVAKSKTINFAVLIAILGAAQANLAVLQSIVSPRFYGWSLFGIAIAIAALRAVTTQPLSEK